MAVASAFHIATDVFILVLPYKLVLTIQRPMREKIGLVFVFGLGIFSTACSVARLQYLRIYTNSHDPFYDSLPISVWSVVEINIAILCASLATLKPLVSKSQRARTRSARRPKGYVKDSSGNSKEKQGFGKGILKKIHISTSTGDSSQTSGGLVESVIEMNRMVPPAAARMRDIEEGLNHNVVHDGEGRGSDEEILSPLHPARLPRR